MKWRRTSWNTSISASKQAGNDTVRVDGCLLASMVEAKALHMGHAIHLHRLVTHSRSRRNPLRNAAAGSIRAMANIACQSGLSVVRRTEIYLAIVGYDI